MNKKRLCGECRYYGYFCKNWSHWYWKCNFYEKACKHFEEDEEKERGKK